MQAFSTGRGKGRGRISRVSAVLARASGSAASLKQHSTGDNLDERFLVGDGPGMGGWRRKEEVRKEGNMVSVTGLCRRQKDNTLLEYCNKYYLTFQGLTKVGTLYSTSLALYIKEIAHSKTPNVGVTSESFIPHQLSTNSHYLLSWKPPLPSIATLD